MYESFYGLRERPFELTPNPRYLFMTSEHREALCTIQYGLSSPKGITLLLGPAGTGKTTLVHAALQEVPQSVRVLYLANPALAREEFFQFFAVECGLSESARTSKTFALGELRQWLLQRKEQNMGTALIVDEAQAMPRPLLEEVRLLTNLATATDQLMSIVLVGQAELAERLNDPSLQQIKQRVALRSRLDPLNYDETVACITERIRIAGGDVSTVFTDEAIAAVHESSAGIPRTINVICDNALVSGFALDQRPITASVIAEVCRDFDFPIPGQHARAGGLSAAWPKPAAASLPTPPAPIRAVAPGAVAPATTGPRPAPVPPAAPGSPQTPKAVVTRTAAVPSSARPAAVAGRPAAAGVPQAPTFGRILTAPVPSTRLVTPEPSTHVTPESSAPASTPAHDDEPVQISRPRRGLMSFLLRSTS